MNSPRIKVKLAHITTRDEAEAVMAELAGAANQQRQLHARRDADGLALDEKYRADLAACATRLTAATETLRAWAETHPEQFPRDRKSLQLPGGTLGFRTGTPKLALLSRAWTWEIVLEKLKTLPGRSGCIRTKEEVDKEALLTGLKAGRLDPAETIGVKIVQDESFFIEPALSEPAARQTTPLPGA
jgi:phage host-nuclease inhibitor protein Gam